VKATSNALYRTEMRAQTNVKNTVPYQIAGEAQVSRLKFVHTDPLPLVRVRVNESDEVNFLSLVGT